MKTRRHSRTAEVCPSNSLMAGDFFGTLVFAESKTSLNGLTLVCVRHNVFWGSLRRSLLVKEFVPSMIRKGYHSFFFNIFMMLYNGADIRVSPGNQVQQPNVSVQKLYLPSMVSCQIVQQHGHQIYSHAPSTAHTIYMYYTAIIRTKQGERPSSNGLPTLSYTGAMAPKS